MNPPSKLVLTLVGVIILACAGLESSDEAAPVIPPSSSAPAELTGVWASMNLPWSGGELVASDETMLLVAWGSAAVSSINAQYDAALVGVGWTGTALLEDAELVVASYSRDAINIGLMVITEDGQTFAYMEDLSMVEESAVESARSGERPTGVSSRRGGRRGKGKLGKGKMGKGGAGKNR